MDVKYPANLDPKLREAYDRVMGGTAGAGHGQKSKDHLHHEPEKKAEIHPAAHSQTTVVHLDGEPEKHATHESGGSAATAILLGIIGMLFFIGYALFWAQYFGFNFIPTL